MVRTYGPNWQSVIFIASFFFVILSVLTFSLYVETNFADKGRLFGLVGFWVFALVLGVLYASIKLEVTDSYVASYLFRIRTSKIEVSEVVSLEYGYFVRTGMGMRVRFLRNGKKKTVDLGEAVFTVKGVADGKRVLESKLSGS